MKKTKTNLQMSRDVWQHFSRGTHCAFPIVAIAACGIAAAGYAVSGGSVQAVPTAGTLSAKAVGGGHGEVSASAAPAYQVLRVAQDGSDFMVILKLTA